MHVTTRWSVTNIAIVTHKQYCIKCSINILIVTINLYVKVEFDCISKPYLTNINLNLFLLADFFQPFQNRHFQLTFPKITRIEFQLYLYLFALLLLSNLSFNA